MSDGEYGYYYCDDPECNDPNCEYTGPSYTQPPSTKPSSTFAKTKEGKLQWSLVPWPALNEVVKVFMFGAIKHQPFGWRGVPNARDLYFEACMRHLTDWYNGKDEDDESSLHPLAHLACDTLILLARHLEGTL